MGADVYDKATYAVGIPLAALLLAFLVTGDFSRALLAALVMAALHALSGAVWDFLKRH